MGFQLPDALLAAPIRLPAPLLQLSPGALDLGDDLLLLLDQLAAMHSQRRGAQPAARLARRL